MLPAMKIPLLLGFILLSLNGLAQDESIKKLQSESSRTIKKDPADTVPQLWKKGGIYTINLSQGSLSNIPVLLRWSIELR